MLKTNAFLAVTAVTVFGLAVAFLCGLPLAAGFSAGLLLLAALLRNGGLAWREMRIVSVEGALHTKGVVLILLCVALLIPAWSASGTIDAMIGLGLELFAPHLFLTSAFLLSGLIAFLLGTSTGTLSAVGIPVVGMAVQLDVPLAMAAGALVSGAFVGDRGSPFSSAFHLTAESAGIKPRELGRAMAPTTAMGLAAAAVFFFALDRAGGWGVSAAIAADARTQDGSLWPFVPPVVLVGTMLLRLGTIRAFVLAIVSGIAVGIGHAGVPAADWPSLLWNGWDGEAGHAAGGLRHMLELVLLIALAGAFNGLLERSGVIEPLVRKTFASSGKLGGATWRAGLFGLGLDLVSCTQTLPIMMTARHLRSAWASRFGADQLGRVTADTSLLFAALVPWNMLAILCGTILGVPVPDYVPYAAYVWAIPLLTLGYSAWRGRRDRP